jgi:signal transduction histidine kinase
MKRPRILNVDDNEIGRFTVTQMLRSGGFDVLEASSGEEALRHAAELPDLILLDVRLPDLDGFEVCRRIKSNPKTANITVVHLSATQVDAQAVSHGLNLGADGYLTEPITQGELIATVRAFLRIRKAENAQRFLAQVSAALSNALEVDEVLAKLAPLALTHFGELCLVDRLEARGVVRNIAAIRSQAGGLVSLSRLSRTSLGKQEGGIAAVIRGGEREVSDVITQAEQLADAFGVEDRAVFADLLPCTYLSVPLIARQRTLGALTVAARASERQYTLSDIALLEDLAARSAVFVDNARLYEEAQKAIATRENLLAVVSHDLKDPLNSVLMSCEVLHDSTADETIRRRLTIMRRSAMRMDHLIHDLLDLASLDRGSLSIQRQLFALDAFLDDLFETFVPPAAEKGIAIVRNLSAPLAPVYCDRERLHQVLSNLLSNAIKFTPNSGRITVSVEQTPTQTAFSVKDSGPGISADQMPFLFDRFWQASKSGRRGTGLGLSIAKGIVEAHGGVISVRSDANGGSTFSFSLPTQAAASAGNAGSGTPGASA